MNRFLLTTTSDDTQQEPGEATVKALKHRLRYVKGTISEHEEVVIICGCSLGNFEVLQVAVDHTDLLHIIVLRDGQERFIISPPAQCSFMLTIVPATPENPRQRTIFGFSPEGPPKTD